MSHLGFKRLLLFGGLLSSPTLSHASQVELATAKEIRLPPYQQAALLKDSPINDADFQQLDTLTILGRSSIWHWDIPSGNLQRLQLTQSPNPPEGSFLRRLGSDGISEFAASDTRLYQVAWSSKRVLEFDLKLPGQSLNFSGSGDNFWLLRSTQLVQIDRYGKTVMPQLSLKGLNEQDRAHYDPLHHRLWVIQRNTLLSQDTTDKNIAPKVMLRLKHRILDIQSTKHELVAHTNHAVMRISHEGKLKRAIPVEGRRRLVAMTITDSQHGYLFDDHIVEIYSTKSRQGRRFRLPLANDEKVSLMRINQNLLVLLANDKPRLFTLDTPFGRQE